MGKDLKGKNLGTGISQRKDGRYQARFTNRFGERPTVYGVTLKEVKNELRRKQIEDITENNVLNSGITVDEWYQKWLKIYKQPNVKETSLASYQKLYRNQIKPILGNKKVSEVNRLMITELLNEAAKKYAKNYVKNIHSLLSDLFTQASIDELCKKNPVLKVKKLGKETKEIIVLSVDEQRDFFNACKDSWYYNAFLTQINTGLRFGELCGLCREDVDLKNNVIHVRHNLVLVRKNEEHFQYYQLSTPKTKNSIRDIPLNPMSKRAIVNQLNINRRYTFGNVPFNLIFLNMKGRYIDESTYYQQINKYVDRVNDKRRVQNKKLLNHFGSHTFRHTFATRCFEADISPKVVQELLGHASINMTMDVYTTVTQDRKVKDMKKFNELMSAIL